MWSIYFDNARGLVDIVREGADGVGAIGSNWQPGHTEEEARKFLQEQLAKGCTRGHDWAPRF